ncbi:hypothetical protein G6F32_016681 [Rhizopus arrhizus]|nr:hypothetical protein G6F32_016681 [Rhizopus arrhizus]
MQKNAGWSPGSLGGEVDAADAGQPGGFHDVDHGLVGGLGVGVDDDQRLGLAGRGLAQGVGDFGRGGNVDQRAVQGVAAVLADGDYQRGGRVLFRRRLGQRYLQLRETRERGG